MSPRGLYLHVPFCTRRCDYCDFYVVVGRGDAIDRYVDRLAASVREGGGAPGGGRLPADTIYIGGGSPSLLDGGQVTRLIDACRDSFDLVQDAEVTLEANPEGIDARALDGWLAAGVNRLSIGIQSLRDPTLRARGRLHTGDEALDSVGGARAAGFENISVDLIAGLPGDDDGKEGLPGAIARGVREVLDRGPDHLSLYLLETDKESPLMEAARSGRLSLPEDDEVASAFEAARAIILHAGWEHYEISSFCRPGMRSRHNVKYWTGDPVLGFGPSAHSSGRGLLSSVARDLDAFLDGAAGVASHELPDGDGAAREALVLNLRLLEGVDVAAFDARWGSSLRSRLPLDLEELDGAGLFEWEGDVLRLTVEGVLLGNEVFSRIAGGSPRAPS